MSKRFNTPATKALAAVCSSGSAVQSPNSEKRTRAKPTPTSKQARVLSMLRSPAGTSIVAVMKTTGWQQHSVRGFLAGVVRRKLRLKLYSEKIDGNRTYRIVQPSGSRSKSSHPSRRKA